MLRRLHDQLSILENLFLDCYFSTEREFVFSCDVIASCNGATFEFSSTGWYYVRDTPIKRCLTWELGAVRSTVVRQYYTRDKKLAHEIPQNVSIPSSLRFLGNCIRFLGNLMAMF